MKMLAKHTRLKMKILDCCYFKNLNESTLIFQFECYVFFCFRTGSLGYGKPPMDAVSSLVVVVISVGLGIPVVLIIFGGIFVCLKKKSDPLLVDVSKNAMSVN